MFPYNSAAPYQQYNGYGATLVSPLVAGLMTPEMLACIKQKQAELGRNLTADEVQACRSGGGGIPLWAWIAGGAVLAGGAYYFLTR